MGSSGGKGLGGDWGGCVRWIGVVRTGVRTLRRLRFRPVVGGAEKVRTVGPYGSRSCTSGIRAEVY